MRLTLSRKSRKVLSAFNSMKIGCIIFGSDVIRDASYMLLWKMKWIIIYG